MSTPVRSAQRRSRSSFSDRAGTFTATPGRLIPLLSETMPGTSTSASTSVSVTSTARRRTLPSSTRSTSPGATSPGSPLWVVPTSSRVPGTSRVVMVIRSPLSSRCGPSVKRPRRILGPWRSAKIATGRRSSTLSRRTRS